MPKLYFDVRDDFLTINGTFADGQISCDGNCCLAACFMSASGAHFPVMTALKIKNGVPYNSDFYYYVRLSADAYRIVFTPKRCDELLPPKAYFQSVLQCGNVTHFLTCFEQGGYKLTIETQEEIYTVDCPCRLQNVDARALAVGGGQLVTICADAGKRKFFFAALYRGDYEALINCVCDDFVVTRDGVVFTDFAHDMLDRCIRRTLTFEGGRYRETSRVFEYGRSPLLCDELLPYAFCEAAFCGDVDACASLCAPALHGTDFLRFLGGFTALCDDLYVDYSPCRIGLEYPCDNNFEMRYFDFKIEDGLIRDITPYRF